jgi:hypothetical protein
MLACLPAASAAPHSPPPKWISWGTHDPSRTYHLDGVEITTSWTDTKEERPQPVLLVTQAAGPPLRIIGAEGLTEPTASFGVFRLDRKRPEPVVLLQSFTGGAHCCTAYQMATLEQGNWTARVLGEWDDSAAPRVTDLDGNGSLELLASDQRFAYRFDSYAGSLSPPVVYELSGGKLVDVSGAHRYRTVFIREMRSIRKYCDQGGNGACAGYVATAARAGRAEAAFELLDKRIDHRKPGEEFSGPWTVPEHCGVPPDSLPESCVEHPTKSFPTLHGALEWFLRDIGYLPITGIKPGASK